MTVKRILVIVGLALAAVASQSWAQTPKSANLEGLTEVQRAEVIKYIATTREQQKGKVEQESSKGMEVPAPPNVDRLSTWTEAGVSLGKGLAAVAKELGVAANDFVQTPVGKITTVVILYKFIGKDVVKFVVGTIFMLVAGSVWLYLFRRLCVISEIETKEVPNSEGKITKTRRVIYGGRWEHAEDGTVAIFFITAVAIPLVGLITIFV